MTRDLSLAGEDARASGSCHGDALPIAVICGHYVTQRGPGSDPAPGWPSPKRLNLGLGEGWWGGGGLCVLLGMKRRPKRALETVAASTTSSLFGYLRAATERERQHLDGSSQGSNDEISFLSKRRREELLLGIFLQALEWPPIAPGRVISPDTLSTDVHLLHRPRRDGRGSNPQR